MKKLIRFLLCCLLLASCRQEEREADAPMHRGVYHWKTVYDPTEWEREWMREHRVSRLYVKLFEVDAGEKHGWPEWRMVPVATTQFVQRLPDDVDVVPVVYITVDAIRALGNEWSYDVHAEYAELLANRISDMMAEHWDGTVREVQVDCDWTRTTRGTFFAFAVELRRLLNGKNVLLSGTVRLHQVGDEWIPFDRKMLMCYNTGRLQAAGTRNSILDYEDVAPYMNRFDRIRYVDDTRSLYDYDVAWPAFGWGVAFDGEGSFLGITKPVAGKDVRVEWGEAEQVRQVRSRLPDMPAATSVLYSLDSATLSHYSYEDIEVMFGR